MNLKIAVVLFLFLVKNGEARSAWEDLDPYQGESEEDFEDGLSDDGDGLETSAESEEPSVEIPLISYKPSRDGDPDVFIDKYKAELAKRGDGSMMDDEDGTRRRWRKMYQKYLKKTGGKGNQPLPEPTSSELKKINTRLNQGELKQTNEYRSLHGVNSLTYDPKIAAHAQKYADKLAGIMAGNGGELVHNSQENRIYKTGENIAGDYAKPDYKGRATKMWYAEQQVYINNGYKPSPSEDHRQGRMTGHFTQVVWKDTQRMGCGRGCYQGDDGKNCVVVCNYQPPGNYNNKYTENVLFPNADNSQQSYEDY